MVPEPLTRGRVGRRSAGSPSPTSIRETARRRLTFEWDDAHVNLIGHARTEVPETPNGLRCEMLFRHDTHTQSLMPLNVPAVIVVAPAAVEFRRRGRGGHRSVPSGSSPLESLVLHRGTWHWGPFPMQGPEVRLFNVQGLRYAEDNRCVDLAVEGSRPSRSCCREDRSSACGAERVELDDAEEAEVVSATVAELVDSLTARATGRTPSGGRPSPRPARSGGCTVACSAAWWWPRH